jgi:hypothetical protein
MIDCVKLVLTYIPITNTIYSLLGLTLLEARSAKHEVFNLRVREGEGEEGRFL